MRPFYRPRGGQTFGRILVHLRLAGAARRFLRRGPDRGPDRGGTWVTRGPRTGGGG